MEYIRKCPKCGQEITYKSLKRYRQAINKGKLCRSCTIKRKWEDPEYRQNHNIKLKKSLTRKCPGCGQEITYKNRKYRNKAEKEERLCSSCASRKKLKNLWEDSEYRKKVVKSQKKLKQTPEYKEKASRNSKKAWQDPEYREKQIKLQKELWQDPEYRENQKKSNKNRSQKSKQMWARPKHKEKMSKIVKEKWQDPEYREKQIKLQKELKQTPEHRENASKKSKELWEDPEYRKKNIEANKIAHNTKEFKEKMATIRTSQPKVSNIQEILYSILDDLGIKYFREHNDKSDDIEYKIGPYNFDCRIPREGQPDLLIECQGEYWHSLDKTKLYDKAKLTYINRHYPGEFEVKYIWEHEFLNHQKVIELIKYWMNIIQYELVDYNFKDIEIKRAKAKDYKLLLSKYHYLNNAGRGGIAYGAYLNDELIAVVVFSPPVRQNITIEGIDNFVELSRFCIHPKYQKFNLDSWFISKAIKLLKKNKPDIEAIISYSDTTFNHDGTIYKSLNFTLDKTINPDYWYINNNGWVMHKKTLYGHARRMSMKEKDYAQKHGYQKVYGKEKLRFIYYIK